MSFLRNDAINRVNLHSGIQALAQGAGAIFFLVILLRAGISVPAALAAQAAIVTLRFLLRPATLPLARRWGLKPMLIAGTLGIALHYPLLAQVDGVGPMLLLLVVVAAIGEVFYYVAYNAWFAVLGDVEHRGHQIGAREALISVVGIVAPLAGGWALVTVGPGWTFAAVGLVQALAVLPLLGVPNVLVAREAPGVFSVARPAAILAAIDGWFDASFIFVWQIALYVALAESIPAYGGAMALASLAGAVFGLVLGRHVDAGHGRRTVAIAYVFAAAVVMLRAVSLGSPWLAVIANALGALAMPLIVPPLGAAIYNMAKASPCPLRFHLATEAGWDVGCFAGCVAAAALVAAGLSLSVATVMALPAMAAVAFLLRRYFAAAGVPIRSG